jgi:hypothetical protein
VPEWLEFILGLAALAIFVIAATHISVWLENRDAKHEKDQDEQREYHQRSRAASAAHSSGNAVVARLESIVEQLDAQHKQHRRQDRKHTFLEIVGVTAAIAAAAFALWLAWTTNRQLVDARLADERQTRAYLFVQGAAPSWDGPSQPSATYWLRNVGRSPAYGINIFVAVKLLPYPCSGATISDIKEPIPLGDIISAGEHVGPRLIPQKLVPIIPKDTALDPLSDKRICVFGVANYTDPLNKSWHTYFCGTYVPAKMPALPNPSWEFPAECNHID